MAVLGVSEHHPIIDSSLIFTVRIWDELGDAKLVAYLGSPGEQFPRGRRFIWFYLSTVW